MESLGIFALPLVLAITAFLVFTKQQRKSITESVTTSVVAGLGIAEDSAISARATNKVSNISDFLKELEEAGLGAEELNEGEELMKAVSAGNFKHIKKESKHETADK